MTFTLHPRLENGSFELGRINGCRILLKNNSIFPWLLIVPEVSGEVEDLHQLDLNTYAEVTQAIRQVSDFVSSHFQPTKLNVACIGNQVRQMHIHIVARHSDDPAWPGVVWSHPDKKAYDSARIRSIQNAWLTFSKA